jgi:hypothetical protein
MAFDAATADGLLLRRRMGWPGTAAFVLAAVAVSIGFAAWITDFDQTALLSAALPPQNSDSISSFEDRFSSAPTVASTTASTTVQPLERSTFTALEQNFRAAKGFLMPRDFRARSIAEPRVDDGRTDEAKADESKVTTATLIPLPRARPAAADLEAHAVPPLAQADSTARPVDRSLMQKLSDLLPARVTLASLMPDVGLFRRAPDLAALGYDSSTAVYDITAHALYLPNGSMLEAHSGMGNMRDDLEHVSVPNLGATPPAVYDLKPRERPFHGVQALRMIPAEGSDIFGRSGLLTHSYMLGPKGDSNGCVSIKDYDRFLKAYNDGEVNRLVVVPSLNTNGTVAQQRSASQS